MRPAVFSILMFVSAVAVAADDYLAMGEADLALFYQDEEMISIATGTYKPLHLAPSVASVITAKDIKAMGARTLSDVLEHVPGLHVSTSFNRHNKIYSIRGIHTDLSPQVLFLVNGHTMVDNLSGAQPSLFRMNAANISRIEVLRGPGSAVYGADALSGVINVITKDADELAGTTVAARAGSFDSQDVWLQHGASYVGWDAAFSMDYATTDGDKDRVVDSDQQTVLDSVPAFAALMSGPASLAPGPVSTQQTHLTTSLKLSRDQWQVGLNSWNLRDAGMGPGAAMALDPVGRQNSDWYSMTLDYKDDDFAEQLKMDVKLGYIKYDRQATFQLFPPGSVLLMAADGNVKNANNPNPAAGYALFSEGLHGNPGGISEQAYFETALTYTQLNSHLIRFALGASYDGTVAKETKNFGPGVLDLTGFNLATATVVDGTLTSTTGTPFKYFPDSSRRVKYLSLQDEWAFAPDWELTAGIRYDHYSDFGGTTNPRLALVWATDYNLTTKLLYGRAFRAPSYTEFYFVNNPSVLGNPDLKPETIDVMELVFDYHPTFDLQTVFNIFRYDLDDLIDQVAGKSQNVNDQDGYGVEADIVWQAMGRLDVVANYAWQHSEDSNTGATIADAPAHQASLGLRYKATDYCSVNPQANWVADRVRAAGDTRADISDYTLVDLTLRCNSRKWPIELAASVRNAFDEDAREPSAAAIPNDFPLEGRSFYIEVVYHFAK